MKRNHFNRNKNSTYLKYESSEDIRIRDLDKYHYKEFLT